MELYRQPAFYELLFVERTSDFEFYRSLAATTDTPILELGIGTGRVAVALASAGHRVHGVDRSAEMLSTLSERILELPSQTAGRITHECADLIDLNLGSTFELVLCPFNGIAHLLDDAAFLLALGRIRAHLAPRGRFAFDVLSDDPVRRAGYESSVPWFRHPTTHEVCRAEERVSFDATARATTVEFAVRSMEDEARTWALALHFRQFAAGEIESLLERAGFQLMDVPRDLGDSIGYVCAPCSV